MTDNQYKIVDRKTIAFFDKSATSTKLSQAP